MFSKDFLNQEATHELDKIVQMGNKLPRDDLIIKQVKRKRIKHMIFKSLKQLGDALEQQIRLKDDIDTFSILDQVAHVAKVSDHKLSDGKQLKILTPKQMLQRLPVALAQVKTDNTSVNLLNKVRKVI